MVFRGDTAYTRIAGGISKKRRLTIKQFEPVTFKWTRFPDGGRTGRRGSV